MKAIILAGGNGTRLHPISLGLPKPMTTLVDKPLLEHIIRLLRRNGLTDICMTLRYLPTLVTNYFGDGSSFGVNLSSHIETTPLGTAGGIKACQSFLGQDDFLVISGDAACEVDLKRCIDFHYQSDAEVTIVLYRSEKPLEYGLVMTDPDGRVQRFIEKPSRDRVYTDLVNTGIYIISNRLLNEIPDNAPYDFARDLFPKLLLQDRKIYGIASDGYWCDVGSCISYLRANFDALSGSLPIQFDAPEVRKNIWSNTPLNPEAIYRAPCYIGEGVTVGKGAVIGPFAVIGAGSSVGRGAAVRGSVIDSATIDERATLAGSVICRGSRIGSDTRLLEGSVLGEGVAVGSGCLISEGVRIWPNKQIPAGTKLKSSLISGMSRSGPMFEVRGIMSGELGLEVTPELCLAMGSLIGPASVGIAGSGGEFARILAQCFGFGVASVGGQVFHLDSATAATASNAARLYSFAITLFAEQKGKNITLRFYNEMGLPISRDTERKLESAGSLDVSRAEAENAGPVTAVTGTALAHAAAASRCRVDSDANPAVEIAVAGRGPASRILRSALTGAGIAVSAPGASASTLDISADGFSLCVRDALGQSWDHGKLLTALALIEFEHCSGTIALPYSAPAAAEVLAARLGGTVYRLGRDGNTAEAELMLHPYSSDGIFLAVRLCSALAWYDHQFATLMERVPGFFTAKREFKIPYDRGRLMRELASFGFEGSAELISGLKLDTGKGQAHIIPCGENRLTISAEGATEEIAEEICIDFEKKVREITSKE